MEYVRAFDENGEDYLEIKVIKKPDAMRAL